MKRFFASTAIAMALMAVASGYVWAKGPGSGRPSGGGQGNNSGMGNPNQSLNKSGSQNTNKSWNQDSNKSWNQNMNKSWNQNMNKGTQDSSKSWNQDMKSWNQDKSKAWNQNLKSQQTFDSHKHPDFSGGSGVKDNWRYRWNNGLWWFWGPDNRWSSYDNGRWSYYDNYVVQRPVFENFSGGPIKIINPASNQVPLSYTLNGVTYSISPGYSQELREDRPWVVQFSRGPNMDEAQYGLSSGRYTFTRTNHGWELYRTDLLQPTAPINPPSQPLANPPVQAPVQAPVQ